MAKKLHVEVPCAPVLGPKTVEKVLASIENDEEKPISKKKPAKKALVDTENVENPRNMVQITTPGNRTISFIPTQLAIAVRAPVDVAIEKQKLYVITNTIISELVEASPPGKPSPPLLGYIREANEILDSIYKVTEQVQNEKDIVRIQVMAQFMEKNPDINEDLKIEFLKQMRARQQQREAEATKP